MTNVFTEIAPGDALGAINKRSGGGSSAIKLQRCLFALRCALPAAYATQKVGSWGSSVRPSHALSLQPAKEANNA